MNTASVFVQWKGTDACLDLHCSCGLDGHFDGLFGYFIRCTGCGSVYEMPHTFHIEAESVSAEGEDSMDKDAWPGEPHPPREGPQIVDVESNDAPNDAS